MRFSFLSGVNNSILQDIDDNTDALETTLSAVNTKLGTSNTTLSAMHTSIEQQDAMFSAIETAVDETATTLLTIRDNTDTVETLLTNIADNTDTVETLLTNIDTQTDDLKADLHNPIAGRTPRVQNMEVGTTYSPHTLTTRKTYTCGTNKVAILSAIAGELERITAASAVGLARIVVDWSDDGITFHNIFIKKLRTNGVGDKVEFDFGCNVYLEEDQIIRVRTQDASTGGTVNFEAYPLIVEMDES